MPEEWLEFKEEEIPKRNPNERNDIFIIDGAIKNDIGILIYLSVFAAFVVLTRLGVLPFTGRQIAGIIVLALIPSISMIKNLYEKYFGRRRTIKTGKAYPGVVVKAFEYETDAYGPNCKYTMYAVDINYADGKKTIRGYECNPHKYLENPYCTIYKRRNKIIAADFKVREKYITRAGTLK